jgi:ATP-dependent DNA ligase
VSPAVRPPVSPMLAKLARELPVGDHLVYEPKWDGFRCVVFRDGEDVVLGSRNERPLTRYFPELVEKLAASLPPAVVLDGEIVIAGPKGLEFEALLQRIHPAESRVRKLAAETPSSFVAFDLLGAGDEDLRTEPFGERRRRLEAMLGSPGEGVHLTPATTDPATARDWFSRFEGAGLDGVVAKDVALPYLEGQRVMTKVKHERTADCAVAGFRWHKNGHKVGSLLLGLYDGEGVLHHVGVTSSFTEARRLELVEELAPYRAESFEGHPWAWAGSGANEGIGDAGGRIPGAQSRWNAGRDLSFEPLRPELVCEVAYDHLQGTRFRHATTFKRWRPDREPSSCRYDQLESVVPAELADVFAATVPGSRTLG